MNIKKMLSIYLRICRSRLSKAIPKKSDYFRYVSGRVGLEIGGPSSIFGIELPVYKYAKRVDMLNFDSHTPWESNLSQNGRCNYFPGRVGNQYVGEATDLKLISAEQYDFVLSSNALEHIANPFKALREWYRVTKTGGILILILPNKYNNFDRRRQFTTLQHLEDDFYSDVDEGDLTHLPEILKDHDLSLDPLAGSYENFQMRSYNNKYNRTLHHHVFDLPTAIEMLRRCGFKVVASTVSKSNLCLLAKKSTVEKNLTA